MADINKKIKFAFESTSQLPEVSKQLEQLIALAKQQQTAVMAANAAYQQQATQVTASLNSVVSAQSAIAKALQSTLTQQQAQTAAITASGTAAQKAATEQINATNQVKSGVAGLTESFRNLQTLIGIGFSVTQIKSFVSEIIEAKSKIDFFKIGLDNIIGSERAVAAVYTDLVKIAKTTPFSIDDLAKVTLSLTAMGVETNKLIPTIEALGDVAAIAGSDKLPRIAKAYTDVMNKGILMKQEINQFAENSVPIYDLLAISMEKTRDEVVRLAADHKIGFAEVEKAFKKATEEGGKYYNMAIAQSQTLGGKMKNLTDTIVFAKAAIGDFYERELSGMIEGFYTLTEALAGSQSAISRTISVIKSIAAAIAAYEVMANGAAAATAIWNGALVVGRVAQSAFITLMGVQTAATMGFTEAQIAAATAMKLSPWAIVTGLILAATSAYYALQAATIQVVSSLGEQEIKLKNQKALFNDSVISVMALTEGTKKRTDAMNDLIRRYPEYFGGLSAETTNNAVLNQILQKVNLSYQQRIDLARQTYQISKFEEQRIALLKEEDELMLRIKARSPEVYAQAMGDIDKFLTLVKGKTAAELKNMGLMADGFTNLYDDVMNGRIIKTAAGISTGLKTIDAEILKATERRSVISMNEQQAAIEAETARWVNVANQMKIGSKAYELEEEKHEKRVRDIQGQTADYVATVVEPKKQAAKKNTLELSLENDLKELKSMEQTYSVKMLYLDKEEQLRKEQAKRQIENIATKNSGIESAESATNERLLSIEREYQNKRAKVVMEYSLSILADMKKGFDAEVEEHRAKQQKIFAYADAEKIFWKEHNAEIARLDEELIKKQTKNQEKKAEINAYYDAVIADSERKWWQDRESLILDSLSRSQQAQIDDWALQRKELQERADILKDSVLRQNEYKQILVDIAVLTGKINEAEKENFQTEEAKWKAKIEKAKEYFALISGAVVANISFDADLLLEGIERAREAVANFYDSAMKANEESFNYQVENSNLKLNEIITLWEDYADKQREILGNRQAFDTYSENMKRLVEDTKEMAAEGQKFTNLLAEGKWVAAIVSGITTITQGFKKAKERKHEEEMEMQQNSIDALEYEKVLIQQRLDAEIEAIKKRYDARIEYFNAMEQNTRNHFAAEIEETKAHYAALAAMEAQRAEDSKNLINASDLYRRELADAWINRQISDLTAEMNRNLTRATSDKDYQQIYNYYQELMADAVKQFEDAKNDKIKQSAIANEELASQTKDAQIQTKLDEANAINDLESQLQDSLESIKKGMYQAALTMNKAIVEATKQAANEQNNINRQVFEANRAMAIAELVFELRKAKGKNNPDGYLIFAITEQITEIQNIANPYGGIGSGGIDDQSGSIGRNGGGRSTITYNGQSGSSTNPRGGQSNQTTPGETPGRGRPGYYGYEYLKPVAGDAFTRDSIHMQLERGERVVDANSNLELIQKTGGVSNRDLVKGFIEYHKMKKAIPGLANASNFSDVVNSLSGLPGMMNLNYTKLHSLVPTTNFDTDAVVKAIEGLSKKPVVNVTVSPDRIRTSVIKGRNKQIHEQAFSKTL